MNNILTLRPVEDYDLLQLDRWLHKEHILKWYHESEEWMHKIRERNLMPPDA